MVAVMHHLMGAAEIGARLGVSRQRVQQLIARPDFPQPEHALAMGKVWATAAVEAWIREHRPDLDEVEPEPTGGRKARMTGSRRIPKRPPPDDL